MINHIVMWKFHQNLTEEEREKIATQMKTKSEKLAKDIDGLKSLHVIINPLNTSNCDILLVSTFDTVTALQLFQDNPKHMEIKSDLMPFFVSRSCVDY